MCGIVGFNWSDKVLVKKMSDLMAHRGPDDSGFFVDKHISLGHRRLSILDLSEKGHQPMFNEKEDLVIVFNGEIYNYKKVKESLKKNHEFISHTDTEVIIHGYEEFGENIFSMLEGMFAIALWDIKAKRILLARDRIGKKPLYYYLNDGKLIFASEIKSILSHEEINREIDYQCLSDYLSLRYSSEERTIFKNIKKLNPGSYLIFEKGKISIKKHWSIPEFSSSGIPDEKHTDILIEDAVRKRLMSDVPIGVFLSGGLDSSAITAYMSRLTNKINTFSVGFGDSTDETKYANLIADKFGTNHKDILLDQEILQYLPNVVYHFDEPFADPASLPTFLLCREVSKKVKVALSGEGGDETFGGYQTFNYLSNLRLIKKIPVSLSKYLISPSLNVSSNFFKYPKKQIFKLSAEIFDNPKDILENEKKLFYFPFSKKDKSEILCEEINKNVSLENPVSNYLKSEKDIEKQVISYYFKEWIPNDLLVKVDRMSMAHSLEVRAPFLDTALIKYFFSLDNKYKKNRFLFRKTLNSILPREIMQKKKQGFTLPLSNWVAKGEFVERIMPHLNDLSKRRFFKENEYKKIIENPLRFRNDHKIWLLLNFEIWNKIYMDKENIRKIQI